MRSVSFKFCSPCRSVNQPRLEILEAIIAGDEGSVALDLTTCSFRLSGLAVCITGLSTLEIEWRLWSERLNRYLLVFKHTVTSGRAADINDASLNAFITDVTGSLGRFLADRC